MIRCKTAKKKKMIGQKVCGGEGHCCSFLLLYVPCIQDCKYKQKQSAVWHKVTENVVGLFFTRLHTSRLPATLQAFTRPQQREVSLFASSVFIITELQSQFQLIIWPSSPKTLLYWFTLTTLIVLVVAFPSGGRDQKQS